MSLSRLTTWVTGQVLTATALNAEFDNIVNNPIPLISPLSTTLDFGLNQAKNVVIEKGPVNPTTTSVGRLFYNTATHALYADNGTSLDLIGPSAAGGGAAGSRVKGLVGSVSANNGTFTANEVVLRSTSSLNSASYPVTCTSGFTINTQTVGPIANGRDQAGVFASTYIHWYAISTGSGSTFCTGVVSSQPPDVGPNLPTSYSAYAYLGSAAYTAATSVTPNAYYQRGAWSYFANGGVNVVSSATDTAEAAGSMDTIMPSNALNFAIAHRGTGGTATVGGVIRMGYFVRAISGTDFHVSRLTLAGLGVSTTMNFINETFILPNVNTLPVIYYLSSVGLGTNPSMTLDALGWQNPNGDV